MLYDFSDLLDVCKVDDSTLLRFIRDGLVPHPVTIGGCIRWTGAAIKAWMDTGCPKCEPPMANAFRRIRLGIALEDAERDAARHADLGIDAADVEVIADAD